MGGSRNMTNSGRERAAKPHARPSAHQLLVQVEIKRGQGHRGNHLRLHATHAEKNLKLIAGEIGEHENVCDPSERKQNADAIGKVDRRNRSSQAG